MLTTWLTVNRIRPNQKHEGYPWTRTTAENFVEIVQNGSPPQGQIYGKNYKLFFLDKCEIWQGDLPLGKFFIYRYHLSLMRDGKPMFGGPSKRNTGR